MGGVGHVSAIRASGRMDVGRCANARGSVGVVVVVWFVLAIVGIEDARRGSVRVRAMAKRIGVLQWRESIVGWR